MTQDIEIEIPVDTNGNPLTPDAEGNYPPQRFRDYQKLWYITQEPDCDTKAGKITAWRDTRPQPTYEEINAVTDQEVDDALAEKELDNEEFEGVIRQLTRLCFRQENEIRQLKGQGPVSRRAFLQALRSL